MLNKMYLQQDLGIKSIINYNRKSRQDEELERRTGEDTLKSQRDLMDRVLIPLDIPYIQRDEVGSGDKISTRPVFQEVINELRNETHQAIAVKEISRMGRGSYTDMGIIYDLIQEKRIFIITPWKIYDPKNNADLRQIRFELFMSREEFETTRERLTGGRYNKAIEGRWMAGKPPFGYNINRSSRKLEINEEEANIIRIVYDLYVNGIPSENGNKKDIGYRALSTYLKRNGIKSPKGLSDWRTENLKYLLANEVYLGTMRYRATQTIDNKAVKRPESEHIVVEDAHPAIIDKDIWNKAQEKVELKTQLPRVRLDYSPYELTGLIVCKVCGSKMIRQSSSQKYTRKTDKVTVVYEKEFLWCLRAGCTFVKYRAVEEQLIDYLRYLSELDINAMEIRIKQTIGERETKNSPTEDIGQYVERRMKELKQRMKFIYEQYETGRYTAEMFDERKLDIDKEINQLQKMESKNELSDTDDEEYIDIEKIKKQLISLVEIYESSDERVVKSAILRRVFDHVVVEVLEKGRGSIPAKHIIYPVLTQNLLSPDTLVI